MKKRSSFRLLFVAVAVLGVSWASRAAEEKLFDSMDDPSQWNLGNSKKKMTLTKADADGKAGGAIRFDVVETTFAIAMRIFKPDASWNQYAGVSLRVKGDGSENWACIRMQAGGWSKGYVANFPLKETNWHDVKIPWAEFIPTVASTPALGAADGYRPSNINLFSMGKSWNFNTRHKGPKITFWVDEIKLMGALASTRARAPVAKLPPVSSVVKLMKSGRPVTILALGDSITWGTNVGGNSGAYPHHLGEMLRARYGNQQIKVVSAAIGGSTTAKGRQWMMRDVKGTQADLVTVMFGYNEKCTEPEHREAMTKAYVANLVTYIEEVAGLMKKPPAAVFIATVPGRKTHWETLDCYAEGVRGIAKRYPNVTVADVNAAFKAMGQPAYAKLMSDEAHPNRAGQKEMAKVLFKAITGEQAKE